MRAFHFPVLKSMRLLDATLLTSWDMSSLLDRIEIVSWVLIMFLLSFFGNNRYKKTAPAFLEQVEMKLMSVRVKNFEDVQKMFFRDENLCRWQDVHSSDWRFQIWEVLVKPVAWLKTGTRGWSLKANMNLLKCVSHIIFRHVQKRGTHTHTSWA